MKKRWMAIVLLAAALIQLLTLSGCLPENTRGGQNAAEDETPMTRGEWVTQLGEEFGMNDPVTETPYFSDVPADSPAYPYVQAAADWGVLAAYTGQDSFRPDEPITQEEAAVMAAIAAGWDVSEDQYNEDGSFDSAGALDYAEEMGILTGDEALDEPLTRGAGETVTAAAQSAYLNPTSTGSYNVVYQENVVDASALPAGTIQVSGGGGAVSGQIVGEITYDSEGRASAQVDTGSGIVEVKEGGVIIGPATPEYPAGIGYKVVRVRNENGRVTFTTTAPEMGDIYEELYVNNMSGTYTADNVIWENGVTATQVSCGEGTQYHISLLGGAQEPPTATSLVDKSYTKTLSKDFHFGDGSFEKNWSSDAGKVEGIPGDVDALDKSAFHLDKAPSIEDFGGSTQPWKKALKAENKFSGGYSIDGNITINALTARASVDFKKAWVIPYGIKSMKLQVDSSITSTLTMKGNLKDDLKIATVPIPLVAGLSVSVDLLLYVDASGELKIKAVLSDQIAVEYRDGAGLKATETKSANADADVAINIEFGAKLGASLDAVGVIKVIDADIAVGGLLEANAHVGGSCEVVETSANTTETYEERMNILCDLYVPLISVSVGGQDSLAGKIGLKQTWDLVTKEKAKKFTLIDRSWTIWSFTRTLDKEGNVLSAQENEIAQSPAPSQEPVESADPSIRDRLNLTTYSLTLGNESERLELDVAQGEETPQVNWSCDNTSVATVDSTGLVTPVGPGSATITVSLQEDPSVRVQCYVYVTQANGLCAPLYVQTGLVCA